MRPVLLSGLLLAALSSAASTLEEDFAHPPRHARPQTWWHWVNNCVNPASMRVELAATADCRVVAVNAPPGRLPKLRVCLGEGKGNAQERKENVQERKGKNEQR